ncbi:hypothetical protein J7M28_11250 [bacterium]|nr:hypothetical protein [bacterium]
MNFSRNVVLVVVLCLLLGVPQVWAGSKDKPATFREMITKKAAPEPRVASAAIFREKANQLAIFGGWLQMLSSKGDIWTLDLKTKEWSRIKPKNGDLKKIALSSTAVYDKARDRLIVMMLKIDGGFETHWYSFADNKWNAVPSTSDTPSAREIPKPAQDTKTDSLVLFGGSAWANPDFTRYRIMYYNDLYTLSLKDLKYKKLEAKGQIPQPRGGHCQIYDPKTQSVVVFGGVGADKQGATVVFNDLYVLDLKTIEWRKINAKGITPRPRSLHSAVYDPLKHRILVFGGEGAKGKLFAEILQLDLKTYTWSLASTKSPITLQLSNTASTWDQKGKRVLLFGGVQPGMMFMNSVWEFVTK